MVAHLPATASSVLLERGHAWQIGDYLTADVADATRLLAALVARALGNQVPMPEPIDRPGDAERRDAEEAERREVHDEISGKLLGVNHGT